MSHASGKSGQAFSASRRCLFNGVPQRAVLSGLSALLLAALCCASPALAGRAPAPLALRDVFRIGTKGIFCSAQSTPQDPRLTGLFDKAYRLGCKDAAGMIGTMIAVRREVTLETEPSGLPVTTSCRAAERDIIEGIGAVAVAACTDPTNGVAYRRYQVTRGKTRYFAEGLAGYDPALRLALASLVTDAIVPGEIRVATTEVSDPAAFARVQAGQLDRAGARNEGYLRNSSGQFSEALAFFDNILSRKSEAGNSLRLEALANQALQESNLGHFAAADRLLAEASREKGNDDADLARLLRNYRAIHQLNQRNAPRARAEIEAWRMPQSAASESARLARGEISPALSEDLSRSEAVTRRLGYFGADLSRAERMEMLDAQAQAVLGIASKLEAQPDKARAHLERAAAMLDAIRDGRVVSAAGLRAEIAIALATLAESRGEHADVAAAFDSAITLLDATFPLSPALLAAKARKAGWLARSRRTSEAAELYREVVSAALTVPGSGDTLGALLTPYFSLLVNAPDDAATADLFLASQVLQRPGVAQTQAVLARQFSEGNDEGAALFRLSVFRTREINRLEATIGRLALARSPSPDDLATLEMARASLADLKAEQTAIVSKLAAYPRYKAVTPAHVDLAELQANLKDGEVYAKLIVVADKVYGFVATAHTAQVYPAQASPDSLAKSVQLIRDSIVKLENGRLVNRPFDLHEARAVFLQLFGPVQQTLLEAKHLIFEPDGAMLQLPPAVLVIDDKSVNDYDERNLAPDADPFDFTAVQWLGRNRNISIAVSPRSFIDIRRTPPSRARKAYLGLGHNALPAALPEGMASDPCAWPVSVWQNPIAADELQRAAMRMSQEGSDLRIGADFTDQALGEATNLDDFHVLHFATHGLVTAPRETCPARPALVTSFARDKSDGLLSFKEIFDLRLDADLVILSACDTAGLATVAESREAGITTGGDYALDGLARAFVAAGARAVVASHWPVPDDYQATERLIGGMITAAPGVGLGDALAAAQQLLMDDPLSSHPFYWAAFIILGDGAKPVARSAPGLGAAR